MAKRNSKWLIIQKGETVLVRFDSWKAVPSSQDPDREIARYKVMTTEGDVKYWDNGSTSIMFQLDGVEPGYWINIARKKKINADGVEDTNKSVYSVKVVADKDGKPLPKEEDVLPVVPPAGLAGQATPATVPVSPPSKEEVAWDD